MEWRSVNIQEESPGSVWRLVSEQNNGGLKGLFGLGGDTASVYITSLIRPRREAELHPVWCLWVWRRTWGADITSDGGGGGCFGVDLPLLLPGSDMTPSAANGSSLNLKMKQQSQKHQNKSTFFISPLSHHHQNTFSFKTSTHHRLGQQYTFIQLKKSIFHLDHTCQTLSHPGLHHHHGYC